MRVRKAEALWAMKAAWDRSDEDYDPARKEDVLGRTRTRLDFWEEHLKDPIVALEKALECLENPYQGRHLVSQCVVASPCRRNGGAASLVRRLCQRGAKGPTGKASGLAWTLGTWCVCVHLPAIGMTRGSMGHTVSFSSTLARRSRWLSRRQCRASPLFLRKRSRRVR